MRLFSRNDLKKLIENQVNPSVSIFMPTQCIPSESQQNIIRFKNLLRKAEEQLSSGSFETTEIKEMLNPAYDLLNDIFFWKHQSDGLAVFISPDMFSHYCLPSHFDELVVVAPRFHIKPLLPLLSRDGRFHILALSQNEFRIYEATRFSVSHITLKGIPKSLEEAIKHRDPEKQLQFHTRTPPGKGKRSAIFHGRGLGAEDSKDYILHYFRQINKGLSDLLRDEQSPLVLACVDYLFPLYKEVNTYPHIFEESIAGNPEGLSEQELHEKAWALVEPYFKKAQEEAQDKYNEDLLDYAAVHTILKGGTVYPLKPDQMPDEVLLLAIFRY